MKKIILTLIISAIIIPSISFAHPGRTDSSGGHTCRTNCPNWGLSSGEYHYHRSKGVPQAKEPIKSTYGEQGTGYTSPAPEYKVPASTVNTPTISTTSNANPIVPAPKVQSPVIYENQVQPQEIVKKEEVKNTNADTPIQTTFEIEKPTQREKKSWIIRFLSWLF